MEAERLKPPSVLVILVSHEGADWLPQCLLSLSKQTHPRIGVVAVDNGSSDGSADLLEQALGPERVIRLERNLGFAGAVGAALARPVAARADYLLLLHDDTILAPDAVSRLLEAATGVVGAGVVGPKILDSEDPSVLLDVGLSTDRFGYPYSPLEEGEIDQGQYDRIREVRFVSSCALLISRDALSRIGPPDERLTSTYDDMDLCWRAQIAGYRVVMTPGAVAHHWADTAERQRMRGRGVRVPYERERAALLCMLKNYSLLSLVSVLPVYAALGVARISLYLLTRRFGDAYQVMAAWGWNLAHLPGTIRRRIRAQAVRVVSDRAVRRSMAPIGIRLRRWTQAAAAAVLPTGEEGPADRRRGRVARAVGLIRAHPVLTAGLAAVLLSLIAYRHLFGPPSLTGGSVAAFPSSPTAFWRELLSGVRHTGLGGTQPASPALGLLGLGSVLSLGSPALLMKILVLGLPGAAAVGTYRAVHSATGERLPAAVAGAAYGLSSAVLWALSQGHLPALAMLAGLPWLASKIPLAFSGASKVRNARWVSGAAVGLAILGSFFPGALLATGVLTASALVARREGTRRARGVALVSAAAAGAAVLAFPLTLALIRSGSRALSDPAGTPSFVRLLHGSPAAAPGDWAIALYLPIAAGLSLIFVSRRHAGQAVRASVAALTATYLAWLAAAGYLPLAISNPVAYLAVAAFSEATLVGLGFASLTRGVARASFGFRQVGTALMSVLVAGGLLAQAYQASRGAWAVGGPGRVSPAFLVVQSDAGPYRILWLGRPTGDPFPAPGGTPEGKVAAGPGSVRFAVTGAGGASALDVGRPPAGPGYGALRDALRRILHGPTRHGGALLAPFGIRYVVAAPGDLPAAATRALAGQIDLDEVPTQGLTIFRDPKAVPVASSIEDDRWVAASRASPGSATAAELPASHASPLSRVGRDAFTGSPSPGRGLVLMAQQFDGRWSLRARGAAEGEPPDRAFGWAIGFLPPTGAAFRVSFDGQGQRTAEIWLLVALWAAALWLTRRPVRG